jgi:hypothetical protein
MKINERGFALACGILWGGAMLIMGAANIHWNGYGQEFLKLMASVYPGYHVAGNPTQLAIGALYGFVDGMVGGFVFVWLYNRLILIWRMLCTVQ